ncbi:MAG: FAD-dependent oxidoreductase [Bacteroidetes bacterium]|nr:FAD-dependent oxidoreductase [Bacteroidota bacterium]
MEITNVPHLSTNWVSGYTILAGKYNFGIHQSYCKAEIQQQCPELKIARLKSGFSFYDGRIDDYQLGVWVAEQASKVGVTLIENTPIKKLTMTGKLATDTETALYDYVVSATGPWAQKLLQISNIRSKYQLNLARGTRLVIDRVLTHGFLLEIPDEQRIFFVLPYQGQMLIGTTEVRQVLNEKIKMSTEEISYLIDAYDYYFKEPISQNDIVKSFAGLRPLIRSSTDPNRATREYYIEKSNKLVTVFGGKWTTARQLASSVAREICD